MAELLRAELEIFVKFMSFIFTNGKTGEQIKSDNKQTCEEILELLGKLTTPDSILILKLPSGMGLDFNLQEDNTFWIEFYADELSSAFVTRPVAEEIVKRAFNGIKNNIKKNYADLISTWES
jgi:hypothetical protein